VGGVKNMERFENIPRQALERLPVGNSPLKVSLNTSKSLRILGVDWSVGDYKIFDWSYYDCLKKHGYSPSLANMISLHNELLANR